MVRFFYVVLLVSILASCQNEKAYTPKPRSYHRIEFPIKKYKLVENGCPFAMEIPVYANIIANNKNQECWLNVEFPNFNAKLHLSYFPINNTTTLNKLSEDARTFAFKHTPMATAIDQKRINNSSNKTYGLEYNILGNTASNYQFFVSDSTRHYLRGSLYFNEKPNLDSTQPALEFIKTDIEHLIQSIRWK